MSTLRLATWNLLHGQPVADPTDSRGIRERLMAGARSLDSDVVAVQEVDCRSERSGGVCQVDAIAEAMNGQGRFCAALRGVPGEHWIPAAGHLDDDIGPRYGIGLITRLPVIRWDSIALPASAARLPLLVPTPSGARAIVVKDEPRWAIAAVIEGASGPFSAICTHLSFVPGVNLRQLRALTAWARTLPGPRYLLGDLNLPRWVFTTQRTWRTLAPMATYPVGTPRIQFDHIAVERDTAVRVQDMDTLALPAGDHRALRAHIETDLNVSR
ncbi:MAG: endonuclease [Actinobacteria bacterium]|nr:endonuclease [Actinomycetota bacterium]